MSPYQMNKKQYGLYYIIISPFIIGIFLYLFFAFDLIENKNFEIIGKLSLIGGIFCSIGIPPFITFLGIFQEKNK